MQHDSSYKQIFSHPEVVKELLQGFVHERWVDNIDFGTLEKHNGSYITDDLQGRADDIIWRVKVQERWIYLYLLIEFQSKNDPWMALRIMVYTGLLYQDLIRSRVVTKQDLLPPVFPIVVYNGERCWTAKREFSELIEPYAGGLQAYRPNQRYFLLDEGRVSETELAQTETTLAEIIRLESSPEPEALRKIISRLSERLKDQRYDSLRRALAVWINRVVLRKLVPDEDIPELAELQEIDNMLAERIEQWTEKWKWEGRQEGRQEEGRTMLTRLLIKRFNILPQWVEERLENATQTELERWAENILDADTLEEVFRD